LNIADMERLLKNFKNLRVKPETGLNISLFC